MTASGCLYIQTNEDQNPIIHFIRGEDGRLTEVERCPTGGAGSGAFNYRADPRAIILEGAQRLVLTPDRRFLFAVNNLDNSVSSFGVGEEGKLTLLDVKPTGNIVSGMIGYRQVLGLFIVEPERSTFFTPSAPTTSDSSRSTATGC